MDETSACQIVPNRGSSDGQSAGDDRWLLRHAANRHSQNGEDGIIAKVLEVIGAPVGWCVEFGAWDGRHLSNTRALVDDGFSAVFIEGSTQRFAELQAEARANPKIVALNAYVGTGPDDGLDALLGQTPVPVDFEVLSIDIDGNDYHVWRAVGRYRPKVVVIEYNPTIPTAVEFIQPESREVNQGSSILSLTRLARDKGYELVCATTWNCIFVRAEYFDRFAIADNSPQRLRADEHLVTWIFCGFDGRVFVRGHGALPWHGVPYREERMQPLARSFRKFPGTHGLLMRFLSRQYRSLKKRRII
jgi:hypothetical protein